MGGQRMSGPSRWSGWAPGGGRRHGRHGRPTARRDRRAAVPPAGGAYTAGRVPRPNKARLLEGQGRWARRDAQYRGGHPGGPRRPLLTGPRDHGASSQRLAKARQHDTNFELARRDYGHVGCCARECCSESGEERRDPEGPEGGAASTAARLHPGGRRRPHQDGRRWPAARSTRGAIYLFERVAPGRPRRPGCSPPGPATPLPSSSAASRPNLVAAAAADQVPWLARAAGQPQRGAGARRPNGGIGRRIPRRGARPARQRRERATASAAAAATRSGGSQPRKKIGGWRAGRRSSSGATRTAGRDRLEEVRSRPG